mmetsp:Transcript_18533/g.18612  ORF Transcript_18533/g.18612 Transcript_18533/m.18612 type:complete len:160 (-) Transcript_18533:195-674(-)
MHLSTACYESCGILKATCDKDYLKCMNTLCETIDTQDCTGVASLYHLAIEKYEIEMFTSAQEDFCKCIPSNQIVDHYKDYFEKFYKQWAPEKFESFMTSIFPKYSVNTGTNQNPTYKFPNLVYSLYKTYEKAIKHTGPRVGKKYPKPQPKAPPKQDKEL